jgi:putative pyruvate formate lyase activating enzyme
MSSGCALCPRLCNVDREVSRGFCREGNSVRLARAALHMWEEPPISGEAGSGTVFFAGCTLRCVYCQNASIASGDIGREVSIRRLAQIFLELQAQGALNINLVTPSHFVPQICQAIDLARSTSYSNTPLELPIVYNTSGYELPETLEALRGYVDIYLTDFKYASSDLAALYSGAGDYPRVADAALDAMFEAVGPVVIDDGRMERGIIVRHLLLPGQIEDSRKVMELLASKPYRGDVIVSLMNQYTPVQNLSETFPELMDRVSDSDYDDLVDYALDLGLTRSFMQEGETAQESFIPTFDYEGI